MLKFLRRRVLSNISMNCKRMSSDATSTSEGPVTAHIREKLTKFFNPIHLEVECESEKHNVPPDVEIHFRVQIVSEKFEGQSHLQRQRMVNKLLEEELKTQIHALRIDAKKPSEFTGEQQVAAPKCGGGGGL